MTQILSTTYLFILLFFLVLFSYYISNEILKHIQEENIFNLPGVINKNNEELDTLLHFNLIKVYSKRSITDAALYEIEFLLNSTNNSYSNIAISNLYGLMGENFEILKDYKSAIKAYSTATKISNKNTKAMQKLTRLIDKDKKSSSN